MTGRAHGRRAAAALRGLAAMIMLLLLVVGLPAVLYRFGGSPVPHRLPSLHQAGTALMRRDSGELFFAAVRDVSWLAWALFSLAVVAEATAVIRGRRAPRLRIGGLQNLAGQLVALVALTFSSPATALLAAAQAGPVVMATITPPDAGHGTLAGPGPVTLARVPDPGPLAAAGHGAGTDHSWTGAAGGQPASPPAAPQVMSMASYQAVVVRPGECLWTIAQRYLGDGDRFHEIVKLNIGHVMGHGQVFSDPSVVWPGWVLQLPATASHLQQQPAQQQARHPSHPSRDHRFSRPHPAAGQRRLAWPGGPGGLARPGRLGGPGGGPGGGIRARTDRAEPPGQPAGRRSVGAHPAAADPAHRRLRRRDADRRGHGVDRADAASAAAGPAAGPADTHARQRAGDGRGAAAARGQAAAACHRAACGA